VDLFHEFYNRKIILEIWKIAEALDFYRNIHVVYFIYILVPIILQKQPQTFPKLYFSPCNFTFRSLFNFLKLQLGHFLN
jgi:hypothetical protein